MNGRFVFGMAIALLIGETIAPLRSEAGDEFSKIRDVWRKLWPKSPEALRFVRTAEWRSELLDRRLPPAMDDAFGVFRNGRGGVFLPLTPARQELALDGNRFATRVRLLDSKGAPVGAASHVIFDGKDSLHWDTEFKRVFYIPGKAPHLTLPGDVYGDMTGVRPVVSNCRGCPEGADGFKVEPFEIWDLRLEQDYRMVGVETVDNHRCVVLERPGWDKLWLGENLGYAIVRREWKWHKDGPLKVRIENRDFRRVDSLRWMPFDCRMDWFDSRKSANYRRFGSFFVKLLAFSMDVPEDRFQLEKLPAGTSVQDYHSQRQYVVMYDSDGREYRVAEAPLGLGAPARRWRLSMLLDWRVFASAFAGLLLIAAALKLRRMLRHDHVAD